MPLLDKSTLHRRFKELVSQSDQIDIAVAWVRSCDEIDSLIQSEAKVRIVAGISKNWTDPSVLKHLAECEHIQLRIEPNKPIGVFHPKYYTFHGDTTVHWVGSANLTQGGFGFNDELVYEFSEDDIESSGWFEHIWLKLEPDPWPAITEYDRSYTPPSRSPRRADSKVTKRDLPKLADIRTWEDFVEGLHAYDRYCCYKQFRFDVLGETHSWLHTIRVGHEIVRRNNWNGFSELEYDILAPSTRKSHEGGAWGVLGFVRGGGAYLLNPIRKSEVAPIRLKVRQQIGRVLRANSEEIAEVAFEMLQLISQTRYKTEYKRGIGPASTTRWLAFARPEHLVSVNSASAAGLGESANLPTHQKNLAKVYDELINWLQDQQ